MRNFLQEIHIATAGIKPAYVIVKDMRASAQVFAHGSANRKYIGSGSGRSMK